MTRYRIVVAVCRMLGHPERRVRRPDGATDAACLCRNVEFTEHQRLDDAGLGLAAVTAARHRSEVDTEIARRAEIMDAVDAHESVYEDLALGRWRLSTSEDADDE